MAEIIKRSFSAGEITPSLYARVDQSKYQTGLRTCRNFMVKRHGGAQNRPGTVFVAEVKQSAKTVRLLPFVFNSDQTYILEFGDQYMRVYRNGVQLTDSTATITGVTQADPGVVTTSAPHGLSSGDEVQISGVEGMRELNNRNFKLGGVTATTFQLREMDQSLLNTVGYGAYTSGGTAEGVFTIATPYVEADLMDIRFAQSADVINLVHPSYAPRELARTGHTSWSLNTITFAPSIAAPTGTTTDKEGGTIFAFSYFVTAISEFGEESLTSNTAVANTSPATTVIRITWSAVTGANSYKVYRNDLGGGPPHGTGLIGETAVNTIFRDDDTATIDFGAYPPQSDNPFSSADNYPSAVAYYQGRLAFANTNNNPETVWMSHSGSFKNFSIPFPATDASRVVFTMAGTQVNSIQHMLDIGSLVVFTSSGEWSVQGNDAGIVTPTSVNPLQQSYNGAGALPPIVINNNAIYVQARGTKVRDLSRTIQSDGYSGNEITIFASHLFDDYTLVDWAYQKIPDSTVWAVRSDGTLLGMTYLKEHEILGWHRHDFQGETVERVMAIPNGNEDTPYLVIKRTIDGKVVRYIERFETRQLDDIKDAVFMDSSLSFDGTNNGVETVTLSGGTTWAYDETITLTISTGFFVASDVGNAIHITDSSGDIIRFAIEGFTSSTVVTGKPHKTVPVSLRSTAVLTWALAVDMLEGLWHIEGETVSVLGDGFVVGSPNNPSYTTFTVTNGAISLDKPYSVIHVGLPITSDIETLDIDVLSSETMADKKKIVDHVSVFTEETRGMWAGDKPPSDDATDPLEGLREFRSRNSENQELPPRLLTEVVNVNIKGRWNLGGRVFLRQIDPVPMTVQAIIPAGYMPIRTGSK